MAAKTQELGKHGRTALRRRQFSRLRKGMIICRFLHTVRSVTDNLLMNKDNTTNIRFGSHPEKEVDYHMILTLPAEFKAHQDQVFEVEKELWDIISEKSTAIELEENATNIDKSIGKLTFDKPSRNMIQHLKPLYIKVQIEGRPINRVLIDKGAAVNILPLSIMRKLLKVESDLMPIDVFVCGFSGNATRTKGVLLLEL